MCSVHWVHGVSRFIGFTVGNVQGLGNDTASAEFRLRWFRVWGLGFRIFVKALRFRVQVWGSGSMVWGIWLAEGAWLRDEGWGSELTVCS